MASAYVDVTPDDDQPKRYRSGFPHGPLCEACKTDFMLVTDHCHQHGWVRGTLCQQCNFYMSNLDKGKPTIAGGLSRLRERMLALAQHWLKCPDCCSSGQVPTPLFAAPRNRQVKLPIVFPALVTSTAPPKAGISAAPNSISRGLPLEST